MVPAITSDINLSNIAEFTIDCITYFHCRTCCLLAIGECLLIIKRVFQ